MKERNSNIELLRTLCMLLMPLQHYLSRGGIVETYETFNINNNIAHFLRSLGYPALLAFVLISGYFMFGKEFRFKRIISTIFQTYTYCIVFLVLGLAFNAVSKVQIYNSIFEIIQGSSYWYIPVYLGMCLLAPIIEPYFISCDKKQYQYSIIIPIILFFVIPTCSDFNGIKASQGVETFLTVYFIGGYIKRFGADYKDVITQRRILTILIVSILLAYSIYPLGYYVGRSIVNKYIYKVNWGSWCYDYFVLGMNNVFSLLSGIALFLLFLNMPKRQSKIINYVGKHTFGVYLFHENLIFRNFLWNSLVDRESQYNSPTFLLHALFWTILLFLAGIIIDVFLSRAVDFFNNTKVAKSVCARVDKLYNTLKPEYHGRANGTT